jgi:nucleosome binding factor SPN SPT16 subunit
MLASSYLALVSGIRPTALSLRELVDPNKPQESNYKLLLTIHDAVLKDIREGVVVKDLYNKALGIVKSKRPELEKHFLKNIGGELVSRLEIVHWC